MKKPPDPSFFIPQPTLPLHGQPLLSLCGAPFIFWPSLFQQNRSYHSLFVIFVICNPNPLIEMQWRICSQILKDIGLFTSLAFPETIYAVPEERIVPSNPFQRFRFQPSAPSMSDRDLKLVRRWPSLPMDTIPSGYNHLYSQHDSPTKIADSLDEALSIARR